MVTIKVLHVITRLDRGGPPKILFRLAEDFKRRGGSVVVVTGPSYEPEEDIEAFESRTGIPTYIIHQLRRDVSPVKDFLALVSLIRVIRKEAPDIVHTHTSKAGFIGRLAATICGVKTIIHTPHGHILYGYFGKLKTWVFIQLERFASRLCNKIITLTSLEKEDYIRLGIGKEEQLVPIHCGIELEQYGHTNVEQSNIKDELDFKEKLIGWVGRLDEIKGCYDFIEACELVAEKNSDVGFLMAGDGPLKEDLEALINKSPLKDKFFILGYREDIHKILEGIEIFLLTSLNEGLGLVLVEAMAAGKPVVATRVGGVSEVVVEGKTGLFVPPGSPGETAIAIDKLLSNPLMMDNFGKAGRERARLFDAKDMVEKTFELYSGFDGKA